jgi:Mrp family chromosome partitioning ATPase/capsular polysaccharide biosynthesis protein
MDLLSYFRVLRRRAGLILVCVIVGAGLGLATTLLNSGSSRDQHYYKATHSLIYDDQSNRDVQSVVNNIDQVAVLVTTGDVPNAVAKAAGTGETGRELAERVVTTTNSVTSTLDITVADTSPTRAADLADEFGKQIEASLLARDTAKYNATKDDLQQQLDTLKATSDGFLGQLLQVPKIPDFDTIKSQYDATQAQYSNVYRQMQALLATGAPTSRLSTLETAQAIPISQDEFRARVNLGALGQNHLSAQAQGGTSAANAFASTKKTTLFESDASRGVLGAILGLLVGIGLAVLLDRMDGRVRTRSEAEEAFGLPVLAEIPIFTRTQAKSHELIAHTRPQSRAADAFRAIKTSLLFQLSAIGGDKARIAPPIEGLDEMPEHDTLVLMITSASPREGKTTTSANLASVFAEAGERVLIVNCDFRRPAIHEHFGVHDIPRTVQNTSVPNVKIVTNVLADPNANPAHIVAAQRQVVAAARERFTTIILDTAPMLAANDAVEAVGVADLVLLVARASVTTSDNARRAMEILTRLEAPLGGVVLVGSDQPTNDYYYYYQRDQMGREKRRRSDADSSSNGHGSTNGAAVAAELPPHDPAREAPQL